MSLRLDLQHALTGDPTWDNFHTLLLRLMMKADRSNYHRLAQAFPNTAKVLEYWWQTGEFLDLPYE